MFECLYELVRARYLTFPWVGNGVSIYNMEYLRKILKCFNSIDVYVSCIRVYLIGNDVI